MNTKLILCVGILIVSSFSALSGRRDYYNVNANDSLPENSIREKAMALNNQAILLKVRTFSKKDSLGVVLSLLEKATIVDTTYRLAYTNLAQTQAEMGKVEEAISTLKKTLWKKENGRDVSFVIGNYYDLLEEPDSAQMYYKQSLDAFEESIRAYPDSVLLLANQHFISFVANNDTTIIVNFLKEYSLKYPDLKYLNPAWNGFTKEKYLKQMVMPDYRGDLDRTIERRRQNKKIKYSIINK